MGDLFNIIIRRKKTKNSKSRDGEDPIAQQSNATRQVRYSPKYLNKLLNGGFHKKHAFSNLPTEDVAATRIQTAFRSFKARKTLRYLKGANKLIALTYKQSTKKQTSVTLSSIKLWNRIQADISIRRLLMVTEGRIRQQKLESQLKIEAKLHDIEADWCGGSGAMEDVIARIQYREEAMVRRERALAYAFSHQWRPNSGQSHGQFIYELGKFNWGWSWMDRWIAARPWVARIPLQSTNPSRAKSAKSGFRNAKNANQSSKTVSSLLKPQLQTLMDQRKGNQA